MLDRELLAKNAAAASDRFHELSEKIKGAETRMKEIAVLREHIRNYIKTRDTYVAYRKAGYSKKFLAEHESEITLHKAAKKKFDELGVKKLPKTGQFSSQLFTQEGYCLSQISAKVCRFFSAFSSVTAL